MHALCVVLLVGLPCLVDDGVVNSGAVIVARWHISWIFRWSWVAFRRVAGVVLTHVVWDYQEDPVEVTVVGNK